MREGEKFQKRDDKKLLCKTAQFLKHSNVSAERYATISNKKIGFQHQPTWKCAIVMKGPQDFSVKYDGIFSRDEVYPFADEARSLLSGNFDSLESSSCDSASFGDRSR